MTQSTPNPWNTLEQLGVRFLKHRKSGYLFIDRSMRAAPLSASAVHNLSALSTSSFTSQDSVALLNQEDQLEALVNLGRMAHVPIEDFSTIQTVGLGPQVNRRLGTWRLNEELHDDLWIATLASLSDQEDAFSSLFIKKILEPWITPQSFRAAITTKRFIGKGTADLFESGAEHYRTLAKVHHQLHATTIRVFVGGSFARRAVIRDFDQLKSGSLVIPAFLLSTCEKIKHVQDDVYNELRKQVFGQDHVSGNEPLPDGTNDQQAGARGVEAVVDKLDHATRVLDGIFEDLSATTTAGGSAAAASPEKRSLATAPANNPIQNAIAIRERLQDAVDFVDAGQWAKSRGIKSNPSAALGKYKTQGRIFAVRSGKRDLYPAFQFQENAQPLPIVEKILKTIPKGARGWPLLSWFEAGNVLLSGQKPSAVVASDPQAVLFAAEQFYSRDD